MQEERQLAGEFAIARNRFLQSLACRCMPTPEHIGMKRGREGDKFVVLLGSIADLTEKVIKIIWRNLPERLECVSLPIQRHALIHRPIAIAARPSNLGPEQRAVYLRPARDQLREIRVQATN